MEQIPDIINDEGFKKDAEEFAQSLLKNKRFRVEDFYAELKNIIVLAYKLGGQNGFRTGYMIKKIKESE